MYIHLLSNRLSLRITTMTSSVVPVSSRVVIVGGFLWLAAALVLGARGALSPIFAAGAGWGDVIAAAGAVLLVLSGSPRTTLHRWAYLAWNTFGVLDLVVAVGTATIVVIRGDIPGMEPITRLPLVLVPTLFVPMLFAAHVAIYRRLMRSLDA